MVVCYKNKFFIDKNKNLKRNFSKLLTNCSPRIYTYRMDREVKMTFYNNDDKDYGLIVHGNMTEKNNCTYINYCDSDGTNGIIGISKGVISLTRMKDPFYTIVLEENVPYSTLLKTDYGDISATVYPNTVKTRKTDSRMFITLDYDMHFEGAENPLKHKLKIKVDFIDKEPLFTT